MCLYLCSLPNATTLIIIPYLSLPQPPSVNSPHSAPNPGTFTQIPPSPRPAQAFISTLAHLIPRYTHNHQPLQAILLSTHTPSSRLAVDSSTDTVFLTVAPCAVSRSHTASQGFMKRMFSSRAQPPAATGLLASSSTITPKWHTRAAHVPLARHYADTVHVCFLGTVHPNSTPVHCHASLVARHAKHAVTTTSSRGSCRGFRDSCHTQSSCMLPLQVTYIYPFLFLLLRLLTGVGPVCLRFLCR